ncbi:MAG: DUF456 domain-containing protein [Bacteroidales bacterium]|nr:DUF456 domain-containing protein [Bacteroidales bacterium]MCF8334532.1 DUF456 domain-containing protein [Bacteroidales bacterium]
MEWLWIVLGGILIIIGLLGCIVPVIPGPPISYVGLILLQITDKPPFEAQTLVIWLLITIGVTLLDYVVPVWGTRKYGGTKKGVWGSVIGLVVGLFFFPPLGIIIGPFIGAVLGEMVAGKQSNDALRAGFGSFVGLLAGTLLKLIASAWMGYLFFSNIPV